MAVFTSGWLLDVAILVLSLLAVVYLYFRNQYSYWKKRNIPYTEPVMPFGSIKGAITSKPMGEIFNKIYFEHKNEPFVGMWTLHRPVLLLRDPELIKTVFVKDFVSFQDRGVYHNEKADPLGAHLFSLGGIKWRNLRSKMSPTFTSGKMKTMFPLLVQSGKDLKAVLEEPAKQGQVLEMKDIAARFTTDIISLCAFGLETNSLKNPKAEFREMGRKIFERNWQRGIARLLMFFLPGVAQAMNMVVIPRDVSKFFLGAVKETMDYRETNKVKRNDFMQLLIQLKNTGRLEDADKKEDGGKEAEKFTFLEAAAQAFVFFIAGFETSSTTMQFALYELSRNPDIQDRVREEIQTVLAKHDGEMTYEAIYEMNYLGRVIDETLRKYPPVATLQRQATKDFRIPNTDHIVPKGMHVFIQAWGMHMDPAYYPNPEKYDPDRFTDEEKAKRPHYAYLPFGEGPRNCIGMRFGLMQTRVGLATLLANFRFEVCSETNIPLEYDEKSFILSPRYGMRLKITSV